MKILLKFLPAAMLLFLFSSSIQAQSDKPVEATIKVSGVCGMCKARIESAALIKGVKFAEWNKVDQSLKVVYKPSKVNEEMIHEALAAVGHDTDLSKAPDAVYNELPGCCAYRDGIKVH